MEATGKHRMVDPTERWPFVDDPDIAVFSLKLIFAGESQVQYVLREHDGTWQFLDGVPVT